MTMEIALQAPFDGTVAELDAAAGQQVPLGRALFRVVAAGDGRE
jgi:biotin carboxyl carrier protein